MPPRRPWLRGFALAGLLLLTLLVALYLAWYAYATAELSAAHAEAAKAGLITDVAKIIPPPCADADNAALLYQQAYGVLTLRGKPYAPGRDEGELDPRLEPLRELASAKAWAAADNATRERARAILMHDDFAAAWRLVAQGARLQRCAYPGDLNNAPCMQWPQLTLVRSLAKLGNLRARMLAAEGRHQDAINQLADLLWVNRHLAESPLMIDHLVRYSCDNVVLDVLRELLAEGLGGHLDITRIEAAVTGPSMRAGLVRCMDGEASAFGMWMFRRLDVGLTAADAAYFSHFPGFFDYGPAWCGSALWWAYRSRLGTPMRRGDEASYLRILTAYRGALHGTAAVSVPAPSTPRFLAPVAADILPGIDGLARAADRTQRLCDAARTAVRLRCGHAPTPTPGMTVTRQADGSWRISLDPLPTAPGRGTFTFDPWIVPALPHP